ncbi:MAG: hypothetical protein C0603_09985 [Denitrovibrio sp.]|nr:MAG: hypothetical protein C0603_09985 [Denitrovibrio sp.]
MHRRKQKIFITEPEGMCTVLRLQMHKIKLALESTGASIVDNSSNADISVIGTCSAFKADEARTIKKITDNKSEKPLYAYGCMCTVNPDELNADKLFSSWDAASLVKDVTGVDIDNFDDIILPGEFKNKDEYRIFDPSKKFLGITFGCSFDCTYCPHKLGVGCAFSYSPEGILKRIKEYNSDESIKTIYLTGTDTACYNYNGKSFAYLLKEILKISRKDIEYRISQFNPEGLFTDKEYLTNQLQDERVTELQTPIQTVNSDLLTLMKRYYKACDVADVIADIKTKNPNIYLKTDIMIGFPNETLEDVVESVNFCLEHFAEIAIYKFELLNNAPIYKMNLPQIDSKEKEKRYQYALQKIESHGLNVHSGGQKLNTLISSDRKKEAGAK